MRQEEDVLHYTLRGMGARVRFARERAGLSVNELARRAGMDSGRISRLQNEERVSKLSVNTIAAIAHALGVRLGWLLTGEEPVHGAPGRLPTKDTPQPITPPPPPRPQVPVIRQDTATKRLELIERMLKLVEETDAPPSVSAQRKR